MVTIKQVHLAINLTLLNASVVASATPLFVVHCSPEPCAPYFCGVDAGHVYE